MRHLATITGKQTTENFVSYLLTQNISTHVECRDAQQDQWEVWIRDEDKAEAAKKEYQLFLDSPSDTKYAQAVQMAQRILKEQKKKDVERAKLVQHPRMNVNPLFGNGMPPLTLTVILLCVAIGFIQFVNPAPNNWLSNTFDKQLKFVDLDLYQMTKDPAASIKRGEVWRILTPAFLHGGPLHLLLNMLSFSMLGRLIERLEGVGKYALIMLITGVCAHLLQGLMPFKLWGSPNFVGLSGVILGLLGYIGAKTTLRTDLGFHLSPQAYVMTAIILVLGFAGGDSGYRFANLAHLGGLVAGIVVGVVLSDPRFDRKP